MGLGELVPDGKGGMEPSPEAWAELDKIRAESDPVTWAAIMRLIGDEGTEIMPREPSSPTVEHPIPYHHGHDCYCGGWEHDDPACEYGDWYPCPRCFDEYQRPEHSR